MGDRLQDKITVGTIIEFTPKMTKDFGIEQGLGVIYRISSNPSSMFPYKAIVFVRNEDGELEKDFVPTKEGEFALTNRPLYEELREWRSIEREKRKYEGD